MKPILFCDFDGTICHDRYWRSLPSEYHERVQQLLFRDDKTRVNDWMRGKYTAEEVNRFLADELGLSYDELWALFENECRTMQVPKNVLDKLHALREKYTVILMTGNMDSFSRFTVPALGLEEYFDHISNSYHEGKHKSELFIEYASRFGVLMRDCIVIDDNREICGIFESLGGTALLVGPEKDVTYYLAQL